MLKYNITISDKNYKFSIPCHEGEMTLKFYLDYILAHKGAEGNEGKFLANLLHVPYEELINSEHTELDTQIFSAIRFLDGSFAKHIELLPPPEKITIEGKDYILPKNLEFESLGQKLEAKELIVNADDLHRVLPELAAIYIDFENKDTIKDKLLEMKAVEVLPIARFFFQKFNEFRKSGTKHSNQKEPKRKRWQGLKGLINMGRSIS